MRRRVGGSFVGAVLLGASLLLAACAASPALAANPTVGGAVDSAANYVTIGVIAHITGDDDSDGSAKVWYRVQGAPTWTEGMALYRLDATRYAGSILWLTAATTYEVDVQLTDPDGVSSDPAPFTITTKSETIPGQGAGTHRYVATTGNDNNPGTQAQPYRTIGKGAGVSNPGDVIHVMPGTYNESVAITRSGNSSAYITYLAEGTGVILDSSDPAFLDATPDWTLDTGNVYYATFAGATTYVAADGVRLYPRGSLADLRNNADGVDGGFFLNTSTDRLYVSIPSSGGDPDNGHTVNVATLAEAVRISGNYNVFDGFEIRYYGTDNYQTGLAVDAAIKNVIRNNTIHNCGFSIWVSGTASADNLITNNEVYDTGILTFPWEQVKDTELEETGIFLESGWRNVIRNNVVHGSFDGISPSMWGAPNNENYNGEMDIYGNTIYDVLDDGMEIEGADLNLRVFNNTVNDCHMGISVAPVTKGPAYFVRNEIYYWANSPTQQASALKFGASSAGRVYFYHNTFATTAASQNGLEPSGDWNNVVSRNNILYSSWYAIEDYYTGSRASVNWNYDDIYTTYYNPGDPRYVKWLNVKYATLAAWQSATGQEPNGIAQNPLFTNLGTGDLTLQSGSPCIDHGVVLKGINDGYSGSAPDMGCYEYAGGPVPPVANFTGNPTSGYTPLAVAFTDTSTNAPTSWSWTFGDSGASTAQHPSHTYTGAGSFTVSLTATNSAGSDGETKTNYITASTPPSPPVANFTGSPTSGNAPLAVSFTDTSTNSPTSWSWTFGDSSTSTVQNPSHSYAAGTFTVSLTATNAGGSDGETKTNYITATVVAPVANFTGTPTSGTAPLAVAFTDTSTNTPTAWSWSFGDSGTSTVQNPSHTYASTGNYTVSLTATNAGGSDGQTKTNYISVQASGSTPTFVAAGTVASNAAAITPALPAGLATNDILLLFLETANQAISISNQNGGTWTAVANSPQGTGTAGGAAATRLTVFWSRYNGTQGAPTTSDSGNHQLGRIIAIRGAATSGNPWEVTAGGVESTADTSGAVPGATTTVADTLVVAAIATALPDASGTANFSAWTNSNLTSVAEQTDNTVTAGNGGGLGLATGGKATAGAYGNTTVTVGTAAAKGMLSLALRPPAPPAPPVANFTGSPTSGAVPLTVNFTDTSTNTPTAWSWTFGDSNTSTVQNPSHTYAAGTYTVSLTATNAGGSDGETKTNYIAASGGSEAYVYPTSWETYSNALVTLISGGVADLQSDNNVYLVVRANTSNYDSGVQFNWDTSYTPSQVSKIKVDVQFKASRTDTPEYWSNLHTVGGGNTNMLAFTLWTTTDQTFSWETTAVSTYMNGAGDMSLNVCGCSVNSNVYDTSFDLVRITLTLN